MRALRRSSAATATVAAADWVIASARTPPPVFPRRRRAGRRPRAVATAAPRGTPSQSAMHALRSSTSAAATVAAPGLANAGARTPPPVRALPRRAGRRPRAVTAAAPRGTPIQGAMHALRGSTSAAATVAATDRVTASARTLPPVFPKPSPRGPPPASRRDRRPARDTLPGRNVRIAQLAHGGRNRRGRRPGHRQRPNAAAGFSMPPPRGPPPANRRDRRPARNIRPERNARIAQLEHGGRRQGHHQRPNSAAGFPKPSPRGPSPANRRDRRPARNAQPGRNARIARLDVGRRHRRGARPWPPSALEHRPGRPAQSPRWAGPLLRARPGPSRNTQPGAPLALRTITDGGRHRRGPQPRHRSASHSVLDPPSALAPSRRLPNPRTGAGFPHNHRSPRFIRFPQPTPLWKTVRGRRSCDVDPSQRRSGPVDMWKTCVA